MVLGARFRATRPVDPFLCPFRSCIRIARAASAERLEEEILLRGPGGSVRGERANFTRFVLGGIEAKF